MGLCCGSWGVDGWLGAANTILIGRGHWLIGRLRLGAVPRAVLAVAQTAGELHIASSIVELEAVGAGGSDAIRFCRFSAHLSSGLAVARSVSGLEAETAHNPLGAISEVDEVRKAALGEKALDDRGASDLDPIMVCHGVLQVTECDSAQ